MSKQVKTIYVRVMPKKGLTAFYRCAMHFTDKWVQVEVDAATAKRLQEEQMLEVASDKPEDFEVQADAETATDETGAATGKVADAGKASDTAQGKKK